MDLNLESCSVLVKSESVDQTQKLINRKLLSSIIGTVHYAVEGGLNVWLSLWIKSESVTIQMKATYM